MNKTYSIDGWPATFLVIIPAIIGHITMIYLFFKGLASV